MAGSPTAQRPILDGSVQVSIPDKRAPGELPVPPWYAILAGDDAQKYVLIQGVTRLSRAEFLATVQARIRAAPERHAAFIYIHGYSNSFDDAARRTAQMAVDLDIGALPVFYSWPSKGTFAGYEFDENSAEWTQAHLQAFLADFAEHSSATDIYIIAHSMGNHPMTVALANLLEKRPGLLPLFKQVVLAAPDINADVFRDQIAPPLRQPQAPRHPVRVRERQGHARFLQLCRLGQDRRHPRPRRRDPRHGTRRCLRRHHELHGP